MASAGDQRGGDAAVAGGGGAELPRGDVRGARVPPVEGPAAGDSAAVRTPRRPGARLDASAEFGVAGPDPVRGAGTAGGGAGRRGPPRAVFPAAPAEGGATPRPAGGGGPPPGR